MRAETRLNTILESVVDAIISINEKGIVQSYNRAAEQIFGYSAEEVLDHNVCMLMPENFRSKHLHGLERYTAGGKASILGSCVEVTGLNSKGCDFPIELTISEININTERQFIGIIRDITERKEAEEKISYLAHHDQLTKLPNRNMFNIHLERAIMRAKRNNTDLALMYLDLDKFKPINDDFGHDAGDAVLQEVASRIKRSIRTTDTVARIGGDEFVVVLECIQGTANASQLAKRLLASVEEPVSYKDNSLQVGVSIGISFLSDITNQAEKLLKTADTAMYSAKKRGRNTYCFFHEE
ncbi:MAG: GGDEF domain-containing protein [Candidatus Polarisedimenticolaceae bacterium]|nr:GGDEF domain-containing protein [Candidatus Polarisedimenticolaceae bacterium]